MNCIPYRRKKCEIEIQKENYEAHLNRLKKLKIGHSPEQLKRGLEEERVLNTINKMRKIHTFNRDYRIKQMKSLEKLEKSKQRQYSNIKSVVKEDFSKMTLTMPPKHKRNYRPIFQENEKILQRILQTKSKLNILSPLPTQRTARTMPYQPAIDFSIIYEHSHLNANEKQVLGVTLSKGKKSTKIQLEFDEESLLQVFKEAQCLYIIEIKSFNKSKRIDSTILGQLGNKIIKVKVSEFLCREHGLSVNFIKVLANKEIFKGFIELSPEDIYGHNQQRQADQRSQKFIVKAIISPRGRQQIKTKLKLGLRRKTKNQDKMEKSVKSQESSHQKYQNDL